MSQITKIIKENNLNPKTYKIKGKAIIINKDKVIKLQKPNNKIINILKTRHFDHIPNYQDKDYIYYDYIKEIKTPKEEKQLTMLELLSDLHYKTTTYEKTNQENINKIIEDLEENITYIDNYYQEKITKIEEKTLYSPFDYTLIVNINIINKSLLKAKEDLEALKTNLKEIKQIRKTINHGNPKLDNLIKNKTNYLISWTKAKKDLPIYDIYKYYYYNKPTNFKQQLKKYEEKYPLKEDEKTILKILIETPRILIEKTNYNKTKEITKEINRLKDIT